TPSMPAINTQTLYLAGHSSKLFERNVGCVKTRYLNQTGDWVTRSLIYVFTFDTEPWVTQAGAFQVKWEPYSPLLRVKASDYVRDNLGAKPDYFIRTYDNDFLLLSDLKEVRSTCSLWVTLKYVDRIPETINRTFYTICPDPVPVPFDERCYPGGHHHHHH
uniref:JAPANIN n=1 Tax=Rhipicephalus appendiculatus TaxID=34631 RepID=UPI00045FEBE4|nr:Chain A, JAPANIN [Rhipicephalus appendiculatus]4BQU_A Chain A, JAPANIN [Rhipicephalus appendiculatus]4BQU_B Chain B, JAPANIN [Rhipicephalus appendiculatus]